MQGVYFRVFTQNKAKQLGVHGAVANLPDGRVEIIAEADGAVIEKFIQWSCKGPITARVDQIEVTELEPGGEFSAFVIR